MLSLDFQWDQQMKNMLKTVPSPPHHQGPKGQTPTSAWLLHLGVLILALQGNYTRPFFPEPTADDINCSLRNANGLAWISPSEPSGCPRKRWYMAKHYLICSPHRWGDNWPYADVKWKILIEEGRGQVPARMFSLYIHCNLQLGFTISAAWYAASCQWCSFQHLWNTQHSQALDWI